MRILRVRDVMAKTGLTRGNIYHLVRSGQFPLQVPLSAGTVGWLEHEIDDWIQAKAANRHQRGPDLDRRGYRPGGRKPAAKPRPKPPHLVDLPAT